MKNKLIKKIFAAVGLLVLTFVALNMNACSKDKNNNNPYAMYGYGNGMYGGQGNLGYFTSVSGDGMLQLRLTFGSNGSQVWANGELYVNGYSAGCSLYPGVYQIQTQSPGQYQSSGIFYSIQAVMPQNGYSIYMDGMLKNSVDQYGNRRADINANIPGCPTNFI